MSSANWLIKNSQWGIEFLERAFDVADKEIPFFGDQDAIIAGLTNMASLDTIDRYDYIVPQARVIPQVSVIVIMFN